MRSAIRDCLGALALALVISFAVPVYCHNLASSAWQGPKHNHAGSWTPYQAGGALSLRYSEEDKNRPLTPGDCQVRSPADGSPTVASASFGVHPESGWASLLVAYQEEPLIRESLSGLQLYAPPPEPPPRAGHSV